jgi:hypothetical protein
MALLRVAADGPEVGVTRFRNLPSKVFYFEDTTVSGGRRAGDERSEKELFPSAARRTSSLPSGARRNSSPERSEKKLFSPERSEKKVSSERSEHPFGEEGTTDPRAKREESSSAASINSPRVERGNSRRVRRRTCERRTVSPWRKRRPTSSAS